MFELAATQKAYLFALFAQSRENAIEGSWIMDGSISFDKTVPGDFAAPTRPGVFDSGDFSGALATLAGEPLPDARMDVFVNGVLARDPVDYTVSGRVVTFTEPLDHDVLVVKYVRET